jgi:CRP-like cAMP-binding protein
VSSYAIEQGSLIGTLSFFLPHRHPYSVQAFTYCEVLTLNKHDFERIMLPFQHYVERMISIAQMEVEELPDEIDLTELQQLQLQQQQWFQQQYQNCIIDDPCQEVWFS